MKKIKNKISNILIKIDEIAPNPWIIDGHVQVRPVTQLGFLIGIIVGLIICYLFSK